MTRCKGVHPLLHADVLHAPRRWATATSWPSSTPISGAAIAKRLIQLATPSAAAALDDPDALSPDTRDARRGSRCRSSATRPSPDGSRIRSILAPSAGAAIGSLERDAFRARPYPCRGAHRRLRPYGNILLVKGTVNRYPPE
jgi:hypothetical protein